MGLQIEAVTPESHMDKVQKTKSSMTQLSHSSTHAQRAQYPTPNLFAQSRSLLLYSQQLGNGNNPHVLQQMNE